MQKMNDERIKIKAVCEHIQQVNDELKGEIELFNINDDLDREDINKINLVINNINYQSKYNAEMKIDEEYVSVIFKEDEFKISRSVFCKSKDKFIVAFNKIKEKYHGLNQNNYEIYYNNNLIDLNKTFIENNLKNGVIVNLLKVNN